MTPVEIVVWPNGRRAGDAARLAGAQHDQSLPALPSNVQKLTSSVKKGASSRISSEASLYNVTMSYI